jgi:hypothetical protein
MEAEALTTVCATSASPKCSTTSVWPLCSSICFRRANRRPTHSTPEFYSTSLCWRSGSAPRRGGQQPELAELPIGYFGASTGAAAAISAAAMEGTRVSALVTRGGRPELANDAIQRLRAPTLLIVGGNDESVAALNLETWARLTCEKAIEIIPGVGHWFEEPGALENVGALAARWFDDHLKIREQQLTG